MVDAEKTSIPKPRRPNTEEEDQEEGRKRNAEIFQQLKDGKLEGKVIVVLIIGPVGAGKTNLVKLMTGQNIRVGHEMKSGTVDGMCFLTKIKEQMYLFIDTPGFGHPSLPLSKVKHAIHHTVGYFTRRLGGIHGILYVQSIIDPRTSHGMKESIEFLDHLVGQRIRSRITFITTKWDLVVQKEERRCQKRETEMKTKEWKDFRVEDAEGARYFAHGASSDDSDEERVEATEKLFDRVLLQYQNTKPESLVMPFSEWTFLEQLGQSISYVAQTALGISVVGAITLGVITGGGLTISIAILI